MEFAKLNGMLKTPLPQPNLKLSQHLGPATESLLDSLDAVLVILPQSDLRRRWPDFPYQKRLRRLLHQKRLRRLPRDESDALEPARMDLPNARATVAVLASAKPGAPIFDLLTLARKALAKVQEGRSKTLGLMLPGHPEDERVRLAEAVVAAVAAATFEPPAFKQRREPACHVEKLILFGGQRRLDFRRTLAAAEGNALARWLTLLPANHLTPTHYLSHVRQLARHHGWRLQFLNVKKLEALGAGAFLAVCRGSNSSDAGIVHLSYHPKTPRTPKLPKSKPRRPKAVALVGKGICYDTGGVNLKSAKAMLGMHGDMQGSAVALGTLLSLTRLQVPFQVEAFLALARNEIGSCAYRPNEVVRSSNGVHIEIIHTDAEGRMVLADTLALAARHKPGLLIDYATLTGSCITALGTRYSGAFCNQQALAAAVTAAGQHSGERVWPLPADPDYDEELESAVADLKQCIMESEADHILAARFLSRFVPQAIPWIHIDLAAAEHKGGLAHIPTAITGFGVRFTLELLLNELQGVL